MLFREAPWRGPGDQACVGALFFAPSARDAPKWHLHQFHRHPEGNSNNGESRLNANKPVSSNQSRQNPVVLALLAIIAVALLVLIVIILLQGSSVTRSGSVLNSGTSIERSDLPNPVKPPKPIGDPDRVKEVRQQGKTYEVVLKASIQAKVEDKAYTVRTLVNMVYYSEFKISRHVEFNDGQKIVELCTFDSCKTIKAESHVEDLKIGWPLPSELLLAGETLTPGAGVVSYQLKQFAESILTGVAESASRKQIESWIKTDSLEGKRVRIMYVDGGDQLIEPVGCTLDEHEQCFLANSALLSDGYLFPDIYVRPGRPWSVDASQLAGYLDPSLRGTPSGTITVVRQNDEQIGNKDYAHLRIINGMVQFDSSTSSKAKIGTLKPRGTLTYNITDGFISAGMLEGRGTLQQVSKDHILFETAFRSDPAFHIDYTCRIK